LYYSIDFSVVQKNLYRSQHFEQTNNFIFIFQLFFSDEDLAGDHLLAEAKFPLKKILPQMQKKFQVALERPDLKVNNVS
jgi:hypothetical protein